MDHPALVCCLHQALCPLGQWGRVSSAWACPYRAPVPDLRLWSLPLPGLSAGCHTNQDSHPASHRAWGFCPCSSPGSKGPFLPKVTHLRGQLLSLRPRDSSSESGVWAVLKPSGVMATNPSPHSGSLNMQVQVSLRIFSSNSWRLLLVWDPLWKDPLPWYRTQ